MNAKLENLKTSKFAAIDLTNVKGSIQFYNTDLWCSNGPDEPGKSDGPYSPKPPIKPKK